MNVQNFLLWHNNGTDSQTVEEEHKSEQLGQQQGANADEFSHETNDLIPDFNHCEKILMCYTYLER